MSALGMGMSFRRGTRAWQRREGVPANLGEPSEFPCMSRRGRTGLPQARPGGGAFRAVGSPRCGDTNDEAHAG